MTGAVFLLYLAGIELAWSMADRNVDATQVALFAANLCYLLLSLLLYRLLRPVSGRVSVEAMLFGVAGSVLGMLHVFQLASHVRSIPFVAGFVLLTGYLILRSTFLPRLLGVLMVLCGCAWLAYLIPFVAARTHGHVSDFSFGVEGLVGLWLLVKGVNVRRWHEQAQATGASAPAASV
jgi:hypothetical protein